MDRTLKAVSVDDERLNLLIIEEMSAHLPIKITSFTDPLEAVEFIKSADDLDIAFLDYRMPGMNGVELLKIIRKRFSDIPVVMITAITDDKALKLEALQEGATEFLYKPLENVEFTARILNLMHLRKAQLLLKDRALLLEEEVHKATSEILKREFEAITILGNAAEFRDPETSEHVQRVAMYCRLLAKSVGENKTRQELILHASPLHDVGKIGIPDSILLKPAKLSEEEWIIMKTHTINGYQILHNTEGEYLKAGAIIALTHHEKFDGSGYPKGLSGKDIHLFGRITAIADVFDALTSKRPYKAPWSFDDAVEFIRTNSSSHFDPDLARLFIENIGEVKKIYEEFNKQDV